MSKFSKRPKNANPAVPTRHVTSPATGPIAVRDHTGPVPRPNTYNVAGGTAYQMPPDQELLFLMLTTPMNGKDPSYYTAPTDKHQRIHELVKENPEFAAKAAYYVRVEHGMRTVSHYVGALAGIYGRGTRWIAAMNTMLVFRPDDMCEIKAGWSQLTGLKLPPNAMVKGFREAFNNINGYQIAKYQMRNSSPTLADIMNLVHPVPNALNAEALEKLAKNELKVTDTWEAELSAAGQTGGEVTKAQVWRDMLVNNKLGIMALLKNLRNIADTNDAELLDMALEQLVDGERIKRGLILPFQFLSAQKVFTTGLESHKKIYEALNKAAEAAVVNIQPFKGTTCVVIDDSGSMSGGGNLQLEGVRHTPGDVASFFAAGILKANPKADVVLFNSFARYVDINTSKGLLDIKQEISGIFQHGGTNHLSALQILNKKYDNIIWLSDEQGWGHGRESVMQGFRNYCTTYQANPTVHSFNLSANDGTMQFATTDVIAYSGWTFKTMDVMASVQGGGVSMLAEVHAIDLLALREARRKEVEEKLAKKAAPAKKAANKKAAKKVAA